jgi:hypothetical protein
LLPNSSAATYRACRETEGKTDEHRTRERYILVRRRSLRGTEPAHRLWSHVAVPQFPPGLPVNMISTPIKNREIKTKEGERLTAVEEVLSLGDLVPVASHFLHQTATALAPYTQRRTETKNKDRSTTTTQKKSHSARFGLFLAQSDERLDKGPKAFVRHRFQFRLRLAVRHKGERVCVCD